MEWSIDHCVGKIALIMSGSHLPCFIAAIILAVMLLYFLGYWINDLLKFDLLRYWCLAFWWWLIFSFQPPRPLSQSDLEKVLATSKKTRVAAGEYLGLTSQSTSWPRSRDSDDYPVQAAIQELSKLVLSRVMNFQPDSQDPWMQTLTPATSCHWKIVAGRPTFLTLLVWIRAISREFFCSMAGWLGCLGFSEGGDVQILSSPVSW